MKTAKQARAMTKAAVSSQSRSDHDVVTGQVESVMKEVERVARAGNRYLDFRHDLKPAAVRELRKRGFKVLDLGEHVASIYEISW